MDRLEYAFVIFFITLGPIKCLVPFIRTTAHFDEKTKRSLAVKGTLIASVVGLFILLVGNGLRSNWGIAQPDLLITFGVLLFVAAMQQLANAQSHPAPADPPSEPQGLAMSPIAFPTIITPFGIVALLTFAAVAEARQSFLLGICVIFLVMMVLNLLAMMFARQILGFIRPQVLQAFGWLLAVLQASLAIHAIMSGLRMGLFETTI